MATRVRSPGRIYTPSPAHTHEIPTTNERLSRGVSDTYTMNSTLSPGALSQQELFDAVSSGVSDAVSRLGLLENHIGLIESIRNLPAPAVDLSHITGLLTQLLSLKDGHAEVLEAITNVTVEQPDLSPIIQAIANLRNSEDIRRGMVDAITNLGMDAPDFSPVQQTIQEMKTEMKRTFEDFRRTIQEDMHVLQQEVLKNRQETRGNSEILLVDLQAVPRELEELRNEVRKLALTEIDQSEVLNAIRQIAIPEHSPASIADAVHDRLLKARLRVDNSDILQSLQNLEVDQVGFASLVTDRIRKLTLNSDTSEVLQAIRRLPDAETISKHILDKTKKVLPDRSDFGQLLAIFMPSSYRRCSKLKPKSPKMAELVAMVKKRHRRKRSQKAKIAAELVEECRRACETVDHCSSDSVSILGESLVSSDVVDHSHSDSISLLVKEENVTSAILVDHCHSDSSCCRNCDEVSVNGADSCSSDRPVDDTDKESQEVFKEMLQILSACQSVQEVRSFNDVILARSSLDNEYKKVVRLFVEIREKQLDIT